MPRRGTARTLPKLLCCSMYCSMYCLCVNVYCHRVTTQLQLTNISYHIIIHSCFFFARSRSLVSLQKQIKTPFFQTDLPPLIYFRYSPCFRGICKYRSDKYFIHQYFSVFWGQVGPQIVSQSVKTPVCGYNTFFNFCTDVIITVDVWP